MRKRIAVLCLAIFCIALFVAASHDHAAEEPTDGCAICLMSTQLLFCADGANVHICQSWIRSEAGSQVKILLPEVPIVLIEERGPPGLSWTRRPISAQAPIVLPDALLARLDARAPPA